MMKKKSLLREKNIEALCVHNAISWKKAMSQIFSCVIFCKIKQSNCESNQEGERATVRDFP